MEKWNEKIVKYSRKENVRVRERARARVREREREGGEGNGNKKSCNSNCVSCIPRDKYSVYYISRVNGMDEE